MCVLIFSTNFVRNISHSKKKWTRYDKNIRWSSCKVPSVLSDFNETWIFSTDFVRNISHSKKKWMRYDKNIRWSSCKVPSVFFDFNETWIFSTDFRKNPQISNFTKIRPVGAELFHSDGRTEVTKLIVAFRNFANASKNPSICSEMEMWINNERGQMNTCTCTVARSNLISTSRKSLQTSSRVR
jgi:hypothetical protein